MSPAGAGLVALRDLRRARKANRLHGLPLSETLYRLYLLVIGLGGLVWWITTLLGSHLVKPDTMESVTNRGPAVVGLMLAWLTGGALRSGARGASLTIEPADVAHVLAAPVDRRKVLMRPAVHSVRKSVFTAAIVGGVVGAFTNPFLPGGPQRWIVTGSVLGALSGLWLAGVGLVAGGRRLAQRSAVGIAVGLVAWSVIDVVLSRTSSVVTSPFSLIGTAFLYPMLGSGVRVTAGGVVVAIGAVVASVAAFGSLGGVAVEAAERRARLVSQLRFAVSTQDLRAVVVLRRQLAMERSRRRPWLRVRGRSGSTGAIVTRSLRGFARWPGTRLVRVVALAVVAGVLLRVAYDGPLPLAIISALIFVVIGLDLVEPLSQDADRPGLLRSFPRHRGRMANRQLIVPGLVAALLGALASLASEVWAVAVEDASSGGSRAVQAGLAVAVACVIGCVIGTLGAAVNVAQGPPSLATMMTAPEFAFIRTSIPAILGVLGTVGPLLSARESARNADSLSVYPGILRAVMGASLLGYLVLVWLTDGGIREPS
jgi:hypothetical protein